MGTRHPNYRRVKIHRSYTIAEAAGCCEVHRNTVRHWIKHGLLTLNDGKPILIHGRELAGFLMVRRANSKRPCQPGELYCLRCRAPKNPALNKAEYQPITATTGNLTARCADCGTRMNRRASWATLEQIRGQMEITMPQAPLRIVKTA
jgi:hypothetical protein